MSCAIKSTTFLLATSVIVPVVLCVITGDVQSVNRQNFITKESLNERTVTIRWRDDWGCWIKDDDRGIETIPLGDEGFYSMVLRGLFERDARSFSWLGARVASVETVIRVARGTRSRGVRESNPNEETGEGRKYPCHGRTVTRKLLSRVVHRVRVLMSNGTWPYSVCRRGIKRSRKKATRWCRRSTIPRNSRI